LADYEEFGGERLDQENYNEGDGDEFALDVETEEKR
jgi:hypothetical protein